MKAFMKINSFLPSFTGLRENMKINSNHPCQCCLTEPNYLQYRGSYVLGHSGVTSSSSPRASEPSTTSPRATSYWGAASEVCFLNITKRAGNIF